MDFSTSFGKCERDDVSVLGESDEIDGSWLPSRCELELDDGLSIEHEEIAVETLAKQSHTRQHLDIAAGYIINLRFTKKPINKHKEANSHNK